MFDKKEHLLDFVADDCFLIPNGFRNEVRGRKITEFTIDSFVNQAEGTDSILIRQQLAALAIAYLGKEADGNFRAFIIETIEYGIDTITISGFTKQPASSCCSSDKSHSCGGCGHD